MDSSKKGKMFTVQEVLDAILKDPDVDLVASDSDSDAEDLLEPMRGDDSDSDSDYALPPKTSSEEEYEPPTGSSSQQPGPSRRSRRHQAPATTRSSSSDEEPEPPKSVSRRKTPKRPRLSSPRPESQPTPEASVFSPEPTAPARPRKATAKRPRQPHPSDSEEDRWNNRDEEDTAPDPFRFRPANPPGPMLDTTTSWSVLQVFQLFFSNAVVTSIIHNTNKNAEKRRLDGKKYSWKPLTIKDFYIFLAIVIYTGLCGLHERQDYWRKRFPYNHPFPGNTMTRDRFESILWSLHLSNPDDDEDNDKKKNTPQYDRLFKVKPLYTEIQTACMAHFQPDKNICIDERMVASKARIGMKQYHKDKPTKWGYKLYVLADSATGYTWNFFIYTGKSTTPSDHGLSYTSVMDLIPFPLLGSGYNLYVDNFYTSPILFADLKSKHMGACGTIRKNRSGFPATASNDFPKKPERGDVRWIRKNDLLFVKWMDKREVTMCSSVHKAYSGLTVRRKVRTQGVWETTNVPVPDSILDYNKYMGGVDLSDALIGYYTVLHKTMKWYKSFFYHFLDIAIVNSHILYKEMVKKKDDGTLPMRQKKFRETLLEELVQFAKDSDAPEPDPAPTCMPMFYGDDATSARKYCRRCFEAGDKRVKTPVYCSKCLVPLCFTPRKNCFANWHASQR